MGGAEEGSQPIEVSNEVWRRPVEAEQRQISPAAPCSPDTTLVARLDGLPGPLTRTRNALCRQTWVFRRPPGRRRGGDGVISKSQSQDIISVYLQRSRF